MCNCGMCRSARRAMRERDGIHAMHYDRHNPKYSEFVFEDNKPIVIKPKEYKALSGWGWIMGILVFVITILMNYPLFFCFCFGVAALFLFGGEANDPR